MAETKNILTREVCVKDFEGELEKRKPGLIFSLIGGSIFGAIGLLIGILSMADYFVFGLVVAIVFAFILTVGLWGGMRDFLALRMLKKGRFSFVADEVSRKSEGELVWWYMGRRAKIEHQKIHRGLENFLYFTHHKKYIPSNAVFAYTRQGDLFYLVVLDGSKSPLAIYHSDMYEYKEN